MYIWQRKRLGVLFVFFVFLEGVGWGGVEVYIFFFRGIVQGEKGEKEGVEM